ncbi:MAG: 4Fe-4S dicluster domain-containing protein [Candidatus Bathyarchaeia archaeon]
MKKFKFVHCDPFKCVGCGICEYICSFMYEKAFRPSSSRIRTVRIYPDKNVSIACVLCEDPPCVEACPRDALSQDGLGIIRVEASKCTGCGLCVEACDFGTIMIHPELRVALVCNLCDGNPACIEACPEDALSLTTREIQAQMKRLKLASNLTRGLHGIDRN